jgi:hypothetical protein
MQKNGGLRHIVEGTTETFLALVPVANGAGTTAAHAEHGTFSCASHVWQFDFVELW